MNLLEIAEHYAQDKIKKSVDKIVAEAFMEGYKAGYRDCEEELPLIYRDNKTEYVDLGLPSGTLWSADYEKQDDKILFLPYEKAEEFMLPTKEQVSELFSVCRKVEISSYPFKVSLIGPNGKELIFNAHGYYESQFSIDRGNIWCWVNTSKEERTNNEMNCMNIYKDFYSKIIRDSLQSKYSGYLLPLRLVKSKS